MQAPNLPATAEPAKPSRVAEAVKTRSKPNQVTGKLKTAIDHMVEDGLMWDKAAVKVGLTVRAMRLAMDRPHVVQYIKAKREVFRTHACAGNIHKLVELRDQTENKAAAVQAIKTMETLGSDAAASSSAAKLPGLVFVINNGVSAPQPSAPLIEHQQQIVTIPLQSRESVSNGD